MRSSMHSCERSTLIDQDLARHSFFLIYKIWIKLDDEKITIGENRSSAFKSQRVRDKREQGTAQVAPVLEASIINGDAPC